MIGQFDLALIDAEKALELRPDIKENWVSKACALFGLNEFDKAFETYD